MTRLLEKGQPFAVVAEIMGWSAGTAVRMAKRYGHIGPSAKRTAMAVLDPTPAAPDTAAEKPPSKPTAATLVRGPVTLQ